MNDSIEKLLSNIQDLKCPNGHEAKVSCIVIGDQTTQVSKNEFFCIHCILNNPSIFEKNKDRIIELPTFFNGLKCEENHFIPDKILEESQTAIEVINKLEDDVVNSLGSIKEGINKYYDEIQGKFEIFIKRSKERVESLLQHEVKNYEEDINSMKKMIHSSIYGLSKQARKKKIEELNTKVVNMKFADDKIIDSLTDLRDNSNFDVREFQKAQDELANFGQNYFKNKAFSIMNLKDLLKNNFSEDVYEFQELSQLFLCNKQRIKLITSLENWLIDNNITSKNQISGNQNNVHNFVNSCQYLNNYNQNYANFLLNSYKSNIIPKSVTSVRSSRKVSPRKSKSRNIVKAAVERFKRGSMSMRVSPKKTFSSVYNKNQFMKFRPIKNKMLCKRRPFRSQKCSVSKDQDFEFPAMKKVKKDFVRLESKREMKVRSKENRKQEFKDISFNGEINIKAISPPEQEIRKNQPKIFKEVKSEFQAFEKEDEELVLTESNDSILSEDDSLLDIGENEGEMVIEEVKKEENILTEKKNFSNCVVKKDQPNLDNLKKKKNLTFDLKRSFKGVLSSNFSIENLMKGEKSTYICSGVKPTDDLIMTFRKDKMVKSVQLRAYQEVVEDSLKENEFCVDGAKFQIGEGDSWKTLFEIYLRRDEEKEFPVNSKSEKFRIVHGKNMSTATPLGFSKINFLAE